MELFAGPARCSRSTTLLTVWIHHKHTHHPASPFSHTHSHYRRAIISVQVTHPHAGMNHRHTQEKQNTCGICRMKTIWINFLRSCGIWETQKNIYIRNIWNVVVLQPETDSWFVLPVCCCLRHPRNNKWSVHRKEHWAEWMFNGWQIYCLGCMRGISSYKQTCCTFSAFDHYDGAAEGNRANIQPPAWPCTRHTHRNSCND